MALVNPTDLISISDADKLGVSGLARAAEQGHEHVLLRDYRPVAAVVSMARLEQLQQLEEDMIDASLALSRALTAGPGRHSLDDVLARFGYTRDQLHATD